MRPARTGRSHPRGTTPSRQSHQRTGHERCPSGQERRKRPNAREDRHIAARLGPQRRQFGIGHGAGKRQHAAQDPHTEHARRNGYEGGDENRDIEDAAADHVRQMIAAASRGPRRRTREGEDAALWPRGRASLRCGVGALSSNLCSILYSPAGTILPPRFRKNLAVQSLNPL